jgi:hypothetical protein
MRQPRMTTRSWMTVVLYAALDLAALHAAFTWGSMFALGVSFVLTVVIPLIVILCWVIRQVRPHTLCEPLGTLRKPPPELRGYRAGDCRDGVS